MTPFAASPTYNMIYGKTLTYFPQAIVYLSVCLKVVMFIDVIFVHFVKKKDEKIQKQHNNDGCEDLREPLKEWDLKSLYKWLLFLQIKENTNIFKVDDAPPKSPVR